MADKDKKEEEFKRLLQEASKEYTTNIILDMFDTDRQARRVTIMPKDLRLTEKLKNDK
jgi:histone H3/H4